ncbi:MAG: IS1380 family transposase [bacterium]
MNSVSDAHQTSTSPLESPLQLKGIGGKPVFVDFDGAQISSDGGLLLLREVEEQTGIITAFEEVINDSRHPSYVKHEVSTLLRQRIGQIACGYEDANDSNELRSDPIFKMFADRLPENDPDLGSQPTHSRFENSISRTTLYRIAEAFVKVFIRSYESQPEVIVLDFDDTEDVVHGGQQLALFNAFFGEYCFMPLHVYEGISGKLLTTILRPGQRMNGKQVVMILKRLLALLREAWPNTIIIFRGDGHFSSPEALAYCDAQPNVHIVVGLGGNQRLQKAVRTTVQSAKKLYKQHERKVTLFHSFHYKADTWHRQFRVVSKVEYSEKGLNTRFIVTDLLHAKTQALYREIYCARGKAELFIKDHKRHLQSDRTSCTRFEANQFRLLLHSAAYVLLHTMRAQVLRKPDWKKATFRTIQLKVLKIGTRVRELKTRIKVEFPSSYPDKPALTQSFKLLEALRFQT